MTAPTIGNPGDTIPPLVSADLHAAIGRLVTTWAAAEVALPTQVARLIAATHREGKIAFDHEIFFKSAAVAMGTKPGAALAQIGNLMEMLTGPGERVDAVRRAEAKIRTCETRRDEICHQVAAGVDARRMKIVRLSASRRKIVEEKVYSVDQIDEWTASIGEALRSLDTQISEATGWTWTRIQESWPKSVEE